MSWPMLHETIFTLLSLVDIACINSLSDDALIGVTFALTLYNLMHNSQNVFAKALRIVSSRFFGAKNINGIRSSLTAATIMTTSVAAFFTIAYLIFGRQFLGIFSLSIEQQHMADVYMIARLPGYIVFAIMSPIIRSLEAQGQIAKITKIRFLNLINLPLSIILMQPLGVFGVGLASSIAELIVLIVLCIVFKPKYARPRKEHFREIAKFGVSYLPESLISPITNTIMSNLCLIYLSTEMLVISQLVNKLYDDILNIVYMTTQHAEIVIGREYGAKNQNGISSEFKIFRHCYIRVLMIHIPVSLIFGYIYLGPISNVSDLPFALILLSARILCEVAFYTELPARRILYIFGIIKPVMFARMFGLIVPKLISLHIALICGAGVFSLPICYFMSDLPCAIVNVTLLCKKKLTRPLTDPGKDAITQLETT